jgi:putative tryptophan/tyrosine transport system substrate-binding protein
LASICRRAVFGWAGRPSAPRADQMMQRRALLVGLSSWAVAPWAIAQGQPPAKSARIGYLSYRASASHLEDAFRQGLREFGYIEGQNIAIEYRWAQYKPDRAEALAAELVRLKLDALVTTGGAITALAAKKVTKTIPILFTVGDPVRAGVVSSLDRPGGNVTGISILTNELNVKRLEILNATVPGVSRVGVLANPTNPVTLATLKDLESAAQALRVKLQVVEASRPEEIDGAFAAMVKERAGALLVMSDAMAFGQRDRVVSLATKHRLPGIFEWREFAEAGGLMSYGTNLPEMYRRLATYVDKVLKGAKPADLPVEQPAVFELVINLKTAKAFGLTIPPTILDRADYRIAP